MIYDQSSVIDDRPSIIDHRSSIIDLPAFGFQLPISGFRVLARRLGGSSATRRLLGDSAGPLALVVAETIGMMVLLLHWTACAQFCYSLVENVQFPVGVVEFEGLRLSLRSLQQLN